MHRIAQLCLVQNKQDKSNLANQQTLKAINDCAIKQQLHSNNLLTDTFSHWMWSFLNAFEAFKYNLHQHTSAPDLITALIQTWAKTGHGGNIPMAREYLSQSKLAVSITPSQDRVFFMGASSIMIIFSSSYMTWFPSKQLKQECSRCAMFNIVCNPSANEAGNTWLQQNQTTCRH